jgi:uncharacterized RmlC-like cupin family protein
MTRPTTLALAFFLAATVPLQAFAQSSAPCQIATWQSCPDVMIVDAVDPGPSGVGKFHFLSDQIVDISNYKTAQFEQDLVPPGTSTEEWHYHEFDAIVLLLEGKSRFWWINKDTGEKKSIAFDAAKHAYQLIPRGVPHFVDLRAADKRAISIEFLLSEEVWTKEDFLTHRVHVDEPLPPILPLK